MKNYTVRRHGDTYKIYEAPTKQYIDSHVEKDMADRICKKLNTGCGFEGNTPGFIIRNIPRTKEQTITPQN
jgi:hypothetical protein|tara:strand:- start:184 stop:396 length:213 start_codon:yes stop_codon:yes gene_type:complete